VHYFKHSWDEVLQDFCLLGDNSIRNLLYQRQNTLHTIEKARGHLVILVLLFQELYSQTLLLPLVCQWRGHTSNVAWATPKTAFAIGFNKQVSMSFSFYMDVGELTSARTAPYVIALSTTFSIDGACSFSIPSSLWSDKRRASAYAKLLAGGDG